MNKSLTQSTCVCNDQPCDCPVDGLGTSDYLSFWNDIEHEETNWYCRCYSCQWERNPLRFFRDADGSFSPDAILEHHPHAVLRLEPLKRFVRQHMTHDMVHPCCLLAYMVRFENAYVRIPGTNGAWMTYCLPPGQSIKRDYPRDFNWEPRGARELFLDMHGAHVIDDHLFEELMRLVPHTLDKRKPLSAAERAAIWQKTSGHCSYCGSKLSMQYGKTNTFNADHYFPKHLGGSDDLANRIPACFSCNSLKRAMTPAQFSEYARQQTGQTEGLDP